MNKKYVIAIDGGGSKTVGVIADVEGNILAQKKVGASNPNDIGEEQSAELLVSLAESLLAMVGVSASLVASFFAGVSGAIGHTDALEARLSNSFPEAKVKVASDILNLFGLLEGDCERDAVALICGTGSVCFVQKDGELHRIGGWGYLLDSFGGGYSIGRDGLESALRCADGRGEKTTLYYRACEYLGDAPENSITRIYKEGKPLIAGFAPYVFMEALGGDRVALQILSVSVSSLCECVATASRIIGEGVEFDCILGGGIFNESEFLRALIRGTEDIPVRFVTSDKEQIYGALKQSIALATNNK
jgi:N-acetylglucosamine kinase-like BadF-type ATPase